MVEYGKKVSFVMHLQKKLGLYRLVYHKSVSGALIYGVLNMKEVV